MPICSSVLFTAIFLSSFTTPSVRSVPHASKWKNTTWVNPWAATKKLASPVGYSFDPSEHTATNYLRIKVNGTTVVNTIDDGWGEINAPAGSTVTFEASVDPTWIMTILIEDTHPILGHELYYSDNQTTMSYSWTAVEGHSYYIYFTGH